MRRRAVRAAALIGALQMAGCAVGPDYVRPSIDVPAVYSEAGPDSVLWKPAQPGDRSSRGKWWSIYGDARLDGLMEQVGVTNQTLLGAAAQVRAANALAEAARASWFPTLGASASATRSSTSASSGAGAGSAAGVRTLYALPVNASWEADLWGRIDRTVESNDAAAQASAADLENVRLSIQAGLAQTYFQLRALDAQRQLLDTTVAAYAKSLDFARNRHAAGVVSRSDVTQAETQLKSTQAQAIDLGVQRAQLEHALAVLLGRPAARGLLAPVPLAGPPPAIPASLPGELLERRPDIAAAERRMAAANAQIGMARAAYFPSVTLSAAAGFQSASSNQWLSAPSRFWSIGATLAETLFDGGRREALGRQAAANYDASVAAYRGTVLAAFREVEDNLVALRVLEEEAAVQAEAVLAAEQSLEMVVNQYRAGVVAYQQVVAAQTIALANRRAAADILARRMNASVLLVKALGGGWEAKW
ncbi:MAG: efflux transporter outer membrane subunit [Betaproteobacteria bacterium]|nr:efflux transporter outer membrane subunit [Betaproteobacteria bacterium]